MSENTSNQQPAQKPIALAEKPIEKVPDKVIRRHHPLTKRSFALAGLIDDDKLRSHCIYPAQNSRFSREDNAFLVAMIGDGGKIFRDTTLGPTALVAAVVMNRTLDQIIRRLDELWMNGIIKIVPSISDNPCIPLSYAAYRRRQKVSQFATKRVMDRSYFTMARRIILERSLLDHPYATPEMIALTVCRNSLDLDWGNNVVKLLISDIADAFSLNMYRSNQGVAGLSVRTTCNVLYNHYGQFFSFLSMPDTALWSRYGLDQRPYSTEMGVVDPKTLSDVDESFKTMKDTGELYTYSGIKFHQQELTKFELRNAHAKRYSKVLQLTENGLSSLDRKDIRLKSDRFVDGKREPIPFKERLLSLTETECQAEMPIVEQLVVEPLVVEKAIAEPPVAEPLVVEPLVAEPPTAEPLVVEKAIADKKFLQPNIGFGAILLNNDEAVSQLHMIADKADARLYRKHSPVGVILDEVASLLKIGRESLNTLDSVFTALPVKLAALREADGEEAELVLAASSIAAEIRMVIAKLANTGQSKVTPEQMKEAISRIVGMVNWR